MHCTLKKISHIITLSQWFLLHYYNLLRSCCCFNSDALATPMATKVKYSVGIFRIKTRYQYFFKLSRWFQCAALLKSSFIFNRSEVVLTSSPVMLSSVQSLICVRLFATPWTAAHQAFLFTTNSQSLPNSCPLTQWCHPTISSSIIPFSSRLQSFPASGSFPMSQFTSGGQSIGASASAIPMNIQDWFPLGLTGLLSLLSKGLSRVFSNTTVQKHKFFGAQVLYCQTLTSIHYYWKNHSFDKMDLCQQTNGSVF